MDPPLFCFAGSSGKHINSKHRAESSKQWKMKVAKETLVCNLAQEENESLALPLPMTPYGSMGMDEVLQQATTSLRDELY